MTSHRTIVRWRGADVQTLADIIDKDLIILFVGLNPSPVSVGKGHYHQGRLGQQFWKLLVNHRILPQPTPGQFHDELLLANRFGITDIVKVPSARADTLDPADVDYGRTVLRKKIEDLKPGIVCSVYKKALERLLETKFKNQWGLVNERVGDSSIFILPFPYKSAEHIDFHMRQLSALLGRSRHDR